MTKPGASFHFNGQSPSWSHEKDDEAALPQGRPRQCPVEHTRARVGHRRLFPVRMGQNSRLLLGEVEPVPEVVPPVVFSVAGGGSGRLGFRRANHHVRRVRHGSGGRFCHFEDKLIGWLPDWKNKLRCKYNYYNIFISIYLFNFATGFKFSCYNNQLVFFFFLKKIKYVGDEQEKRSLQMTGLNLMDKTLLVQGAQISFSIWDVGGMYIFVYVYILCLLICGDFLVPVWLLIKKVSMFL